MNVTATIFGQMIAFGILVWFMHRYLWIPMNRMLEERKKRIADGLAAAERGKHDLEQAEERANQTIREAKDQAADILAQAQRRANEVVEQAKSDARAESERILAAGQAELEQEVIRAKEELRRHVAAIAMDGAEQILGREIDRKAHESMLNKLVTEL